MTNFPRTAPVDMAGLAQLPSATKFKQSSGQPAMVDLLAHWADKLVKSQENQYTTSELPDTWLEANYYVDRPRDTVSGAVYPPGPVRLAEYQKRVLREALRRDGDGKLVYSTVLWSEPKKSGKTAIAAGVGMYMAQCNPASHIYCLANDGKQSADRIFNAIARCVTLHNLYGGVFRDRTVAWSPPKLKLANGTEIEAIPCDAAGEAGSEPLLTIWSELWGYRQQEKERLWTEMTIPPTLYGYAMRWVESYAGYENESTTLWNIYDTGVNHSRRLWDDLPVYVNAAARQLTFWSHEPRQPWQTPEYYAAEAQTLAPNEFARIHTNRWVSSASSLFSDVITWDKCTKPDIATPLKEGDATPIAVAMDASVSGDTSAIVAVSRHPEDTWDQENRRVVQRFGRIWTPPVGGQLDYEAELVPYLKWLCANFNVYKVVYDPYQLHKLATDLRHLGIAAFEEFNQMARRAKADKQFYDMVINRQYFHPGDDEQRKHIMNTASVQDGKQMRFVKKTVNKPIDYAVAASMATDEILRLNV